MPNALPRVLIAGVSTRTAADSAARAGYEVTALDAFGDLDQAAGVRGLSMPRDFGVPFTASSAARVAASIGCDTVAYVANFENHPRAVGALARGRTLLGNPPEALRRVRDPLQLAEALERRGVACPIVIPSGGAQRRSRAIAVVPGEGKAPYRDDEGDLTRIPQISQKSADSLSTGIVATPARQGLPVEGFCEIGEICGHLRQVFSGHPGRGTLARDDGDSSTPRPPAAPFGMTRWLLKPRRSGGGHGIRPWNPGDPIPRASYVQERIDGIPGSIAFVAAQGRAVPLCLTRQIAGDPAFGATGFQYCGNILTGPHDPEFGVDSRLARAAMTLANLVAEEFGLVGVNGIDFVARDGTPFLTEVNPRYSASMELVERAGGLSVFSAHAQACIDGTLPSFDFREAAVRHGIATGKSIVYAQRDVVCGDTAEWLDNPAVRDVPHPGERIAAGHPVCTVFADGADAADCLAALVRQADAIYETLEAWASAGV